jgi:DNA-binding CsgD family transcriptional regulator
MNREIRDLIRLGLTNREIFDRLGAKADQINIQRKLIYFAPRDCFTVITREFA